jgi:O-antigen/teichoic acid export membrane protein
MANEESSGIYEKFARDTGIMTLVHIFTGLRSLVLLPIITKTLDAYSYGVWAQVTVTLLLVFPLCTLGLDYALNRFLPHKTDRGEIREAFFSILVVVMGCSAVIALIIILLRNPIADALFGDADMASIAILMGATLLFRALASSCTNYFRAFRQTKTYAALSIALEVGEVGLAAYLVLAGYGIQGAVLALLIARVFIFLVALALIIRQVGVSLPHFTDIKPYLGFSIPLMTLPLIWWILSWSDRYIITIFLNTEQVGIYSAAYVIGSACALYIGPLTDLMLATLSKLYDEEKIDEVKTILSRSLKYSLMLVIPSVFGVSVLSKPLLVLFTTAEFADANPAIVTLIASAVAVFGITNITVYSLQLVRKARLIALIWLIAAVTNIVLNLILIPWIGIVGAAIATLFSFTLASIIVTRFSLKSLPFRIEWLFVLKSLIASAVMGAVLWFAAPDGLAGVVLWIVTGAVIYFCILLLLQGLTREEIKSLWGLFKRAILKR